MVSLDRNMHGATLHPDIIVAYRRCCICRAQSVTVKQSFPGQGQANKLTPTRSTVLRQSLLLAVSPMTPRAACSQAHSAAVNSSVTLRTGAQIPAVGLGVFLARSGKETYNAVLSSLKLGYRHVDTARMYGNEADVGRAIRDSGIPREEVFVTSKLYDVDWGYDAATDALNDSLATLGMQYLDLMLMHHPGQRRGRKETWQALEAAHKQGLCRSIGVSNFGIGHLEQLLQYAKVVPAVNQIELSPFLQRKELVDYCRSQGIALEAYSPLCKATKLRHPVITKVASRHKVTSAQVLVRWSLQKGFIPLPKSVKADRQATNIDVFGFELDQEDMDMLDKLECHGVTAWDPSSQDPV
ncbi:hypothetical protein ABBQ38_010892 [Trebouxia sp. C0009 RCD-2024]